MIIDHIHASKHLLFIFPFWFSSSSSSSSHSVDSVSENANSAALVVRTEATFEKKGKKMLISITIIVLIHMH